MMGLQEKVFVSILEVNRGPFEAIFAYFGESQMITITISRFSADGELLPRPPDGNYRISIEPVILNVVRRR